MDKTKILDAVKSAFETKGSRKFTQSVELALNFQGVDFSKPDKRVNLEVLLPKGRGKTVGVIVFAESQMALDAKKAGYEVHPGSEIEKLAGDRPRLKKLSQENVFLAQPSLMMLVGKHLGQFLGPRDNLPKPLVGADIKTLGERSRNSVRLRNKGKNLPTLQCVVGSELLSPEDVADNVSAVVDAIEAKTGSGTVKSAFVKLTMGKPVRII